MQTIVTLISWTFAILSALHPYIVLVMLILKLPALYVLPAILLLVKMGNLYSFKKTPLLSFGITILFFFLAIIQGRPIFYAIAIMGMGYSLNRLVRTVNDTKMPVFLNFESIATAGVPEQIYRLRKNMEESDKHRDASKYKRVNLKILADWIPVPLTGSIASIGDLFIWTGAIGVLIF